MNNAGENKKMSTKKKREKERIANKNLRSKKKCGKGCSNGLEYIDESRFVSTHWINDIFFFFPVATIIPVSSACIFTEAIVSPILVKRASHAVKWHI